MYEKKRSYVKRQDLSARSRRVAIATASKERKQKTQHAGIHTQGRRTAVLIECVGTVAVAGIASAGILSGYAVVVVVAEKRYQK